jgi:hypothetical protein
MGNIWKYMVYGYVVIVWGYPNSWMVYIMEILIKMDDMVVHFRKSLYGDICGELMWK